MTNSEPNAAPPDMYHAAREQIEHDLAFMVARGILRRIDSVSAGELTEVGTIDSYYDRYGQDNIVVWPVATDDEVKAEHVVYVYIPADEKTAQEASS